ncbi:MICAL-like protein 2 [Clupea harengus]|uniref:MICAL-like protein 2 n=1 Tax=Clupea harengus TaxID=7950 RepID=A0A6P8G102_CLUHA|nr:MICAL-like protein 2 [Clupea harengus]
MAAVKALQQWCKIQCEGYRDVAITNMTTSFRDGLAFCAVIHKQRPDLIDFDSLRKENIYENNHLAFRVAEEQLGIPALLDAEDMVALKIPDRLSILTYMSQYYNYFHGKSPIGGMAGIKRPAENSGDQPSGKKNQPITAKTYSPAAPSTQNQPITAKTYTPATPPTPSQREVLSERTNKTGTLSSSCSVCNKHVHLVQRHLVEGRLYHRNCFKCSECSIILLSGTYKPGVKPGTFICTTHNTFSPPSSQSPRNPPSPNPSTRNPPTSNPRPWIATSTSHGEFSPKATPSPSKPTGPSWLVTKSDRTVTPTPSPRQQQATAAMVSPNTSNKLDRNTTRTPSISFTETHSSSPASSLSSSAAKTQNARLQFFESGTSSGTMKAPSGTADKEKPTGRNNGTESGSAGPMGEKKGRVLLKVGDWKKEGKKESEAERESESDREKEKEKAKGMIGRRLVDEKNSSSTNPPLKTHGGKSTDSSGQVRPKPLDVPLMTNTTPTDKPSPACMSKTNKDSKPVLTPPKENDSAPTSWRSMLKPVSRETKSVSSIDLVLPSSTETPRPKSPSRLWGDSAGKPQASGPTSSLTTSTSPAAPASSSTPTSKGSKAPVMTETPKSPKGRPEYIPKEQILCELDEIEKNLNELERKGVEMEKQLRVFEEECKEDVLQDELMVDWFNLIRQKQVHMRRESELVYIATSQDLEEQQPSVEAELRRLIMKPEHLKTSFDRKREGDLLARLVEIVNDRSAIVDGLDEDRLREVEEDEELNKMMENLDSKKDKDKKKSPKWKWFSWKSKKDGIES